MSETADKTQVTTEVGQTWKIPNQRFCDLLVSAFEGGSNYWYNDLHPVLPKGMTRLRATGAASAAGIEDFCAAHRIYQVPFAGGRLEMKQGDDQEPCPHPLTMERMVEGLKLMAAKYPNQFAAFLTESDDAETADIFLQLAVLGELVYG